MIGTEPTASGGNSLAPTALINLSVSPTVVKRASDITGLVNTGQLGTMFSDPNDAVNVLESTIRISGGNLNSPGGFGGELGQVTAGDSSVNTALESQTRCSYVKSTVLVNEFGNPTTLNPDIDPQIVGASGIFTPAQYTQQNFAMTAAVMKMVVNGFAGAGTISLAGFDYHDGTRATGETRNFMAGQCIGACLEYAKRVGKPLMVYVFSDGSLEFDQHDRHLGRGPGQVRLAGRQRLGRRLLLPGLQPHGPPGGEPRGHDAEPDRLLHRRRLRQHAPPAPRPTPSTCW